MKEPVDHILRPTLPWRRDGAITECGYDASQVKAVTREQFQTRLKDLGRQRTSMITCMTCWQTSERWAAWDADPRKAIGREVEWECGYRRPDRGERLKDELMAVAALIEAHRDEFDAAVAEMGGRREWNEKKAARAGSKQR